MNRLSKSFQIHLQGKHIEVLKDVTLSCRRGQLTGLTGPAGCGKSTLLRCIFRTYLCDAGEIWYRSATGRVLDLASASEAEILQLRRREIRQVSQFLQVLPRKSALDIVAQPLLQIGETPARARDRATSILSEVGLPCSLWELPPATFSGGERQLVNLARALVVEPRLLLLDEPVASLDGRSTVHVVRIIQEIKRGGVAIVGIFHDRRIVQLLADTEFDLEDGVARSCPRPLQR